MSTPLRKHRSGEREQILYIFYPLENFDLNVYYLSIAAKKKKKIPKLWVRILEAA